MVRLDPVPDDGLPPVAVQANVYGEVPPVTVAEKVTGLATVPAVGPPMTTARLSGLIAILADAVAVFALASVITTETEYVPLVLYVVVRLAPVPDVGEPPVAVHANV